MKRMTEILSLEISNVDSEKEQRSMDRKTPFVLALTLGAMLWLTACSGGEKMTVPSASMAPTYEIGDEISVDEGADFAVGDVVTVNPPVLDDFENSYRGCAVPTPRNQPCPQSYEERSDEVFLERIVAGPGDEVSIKNGFAVVNGTVEEPDGYEVERCGYEGSGCEMPKTITVPDDHYFMMGDNRGYSDDSRYWGPVPSEWILGTVED